MLMSGLGDAPPLRTVVSSSSLHAQNNTKRPASSTHPFQFSQGDGVGCCVWLVGYLAVPRPRITRTSPVSTM